MSDETEAADLQDELALRAWDGDESVKAELLMAWFVPLDRWLGGEFPALTEADREDVVAEAIKRFWEWRDEFDPAKAKIQTVLFKIARRVACEYRSGRRAWQKAALRERSAAPSSLEALLETSDTEEVPKGETSALTSALADAFAELSELEQDIWRAYADAGDFKLDAAQLGRELGEKHKEGVPIPAGTIRVYKSRAKDRMMAAMKKRGFDLEAMGYTDE